MPLPRLEDLDRLLDRTTTDVLGDTIRYRPANAPVFGTISAVVDYRDGAVAFGGGEVMAQDVKVSVLMVDVPAKPSKDVRVQLPKIPGRTFRPIGTRRDEAGTNWEFEVQDVATSA
ncbi:MAG TPA: hypothetical protein VMQ93_12690 [Novosphingobium sp.]|nr:hypothetical protein [Novosphingobium sp.]